MELPTQQTRRGRPTLTLGVLGTGVIAFGLLQSLVVPVLGTIRADLHATPTAGGWILTAYLLSAAAATPVLGRVGDVVGKRRVLVATLLALAVGSLLAAVAPTIGVMIMGRVVQGLGGGMLPVAFGIVREQFPPERVSSAVGSIAAMVAVGAGVGTVLAGPIVGALGWRWLFWIPLVLTALAALASLTLVPESIERHPSRLDWRSVVLLVGWLVTLLLALSDGPTSGWTSAAVVALFAATAVLGVAWVIVELRAPSPLVDMRLMAQNAVWTTNVVALLLGVAMFGTFTALPQFLQTHPAAGYGFGLSGTGSGFVLLPMPAAMFLASLLSGALARRVGTKTLVAAGCAISCAGMLVLALGRSALWEAVLATGVLGIGIGLAFASMSALVVASVPTHQTGVATGMNTNIRTIGGSIGATVATSVLTSRLLAEGVPSASAYTTVFILLAAALVLAVCAALRTARPSR